MKSSLKIKIGILASSFCAMAFVGFSPIITAVSNSFPEYSLSLVQMMITLPSLMFIIFSPLSGVLMRFVNKKVLALCSVSMYLISGLFNFAFADSLILILVGCAIMGCGTGVLMPVINALICDNFQGNDRGAIMGLNSTFIAIGGLTFNLLTGILANFGWRMSFLGFLIIIPILVVIFCFLPAKPTLVSEETNSTLETNETVKDNKAPVFSVYLFILFLVGFLYFALQNAFSTNCSGYVDLLGGGTSLASLTSMMSQLGGMLGGVLFGFILSKAKKQINTVALLFSGVGFVLAGFIHSLVTVMIAGILIGIAYALYNAGGTFLLGSVLTGKTNDTVVSIYMAVVNFGAAISPYVVNFFSSFFGETPFVKYSFVGIAILLAAVVSFVAGFSKKEQA